MTIGYVPGVWDMFHIGHLNILRRAAQHCDQLVAGVVSDDVVERVKGRPPVIPFDERFEIVASIRYVDRVVLDAHVDKFDMWPDVGYHVLFKGDDWRNTEKGLRLEARLAEVGATVHYFPYTTHTSSTILRVALENLTERPALG